MKLWLVLLAFLLIGSFVIVKAHQLDVSDNEDRTEFIFRFTRWIFDMGGNMKSVAGYVVALDWLPEGEKLGNNT